MVDRGRRLGVLHDLEHAAVVPRGHARVRLHVQLQPLLAPDVVHDLLAGSEGRKARVEEGAYTEAGETHALCSN